MTSLLLKTIIPDVMKRYLFSTFLLLAVLPVTSQIPQNQNTDRNDEEKRDLEPPENVEDDLNRKRRWEANLPGGRYSVNLGNITSISQHSYVLDGTLLVTEVTIDTTGNSLARFYYIEPVTEETKLDILKRLQGRASGLQNRARNRTGMKFDEMAQKNYPHTTHAHTIEFRILSRAELGALYGSVYRAWDDGKGRTFRIK